MRDHVSMFLRSLAVHRMLAVVSTEATLSWCLCTVRYVAKNLLRYRSVATLMAEDDVGRTRNRRSRRQQKTARVQSNLQGIGLIT